MASPGFVSAAGEVSGLLGVRGDPYLACNFLVEMDGLVIGGFSEVTGLQHETVVEIYREGGVNEYEHQLPGPVKYPSYLVLRRGLGDLDLLWDWYQKGVNGAIERRNGAVVLLDHRGLPAMWWDVRDAYPVRWTGPDLRAASPVVAIESIELAHRGLSKSLIGSLPIGGASAPLDEGR